MRIGVISLGCAKNQVDTERMMGLLAQAGHTFTSEPAEADALIVNTCGFIESAKQESINAILELARYKAYGACKTLVVTGCLSQRYRGELAQELPEVDILLGVREYERLPRLLDPAASECAPCSPSTPRLLTTPPYSAYLRIADGCNNRCAYCAIPSIRGDLVSEPIESLVDEAKRLADNGVTELTLIAQDTSGYGEDRYGKPMLSELLQRLERIDALHWIRVLYTYPDTVTPALIDRIIESAKVVNYLDMPLQHVDDGVLKRMGRRGDNAHICRVLDYVRTHAPDFILRTTLMVGFPGETDEAFARMNRFLLAHPFDRVGVFAFSPEEGTRAAGMPDQVSAQIKRARYDALMQTQAAISQARSEARIGTRIETLIEGYTPSGTPYGRSYAEAPDVDGKIFLAQHDAPAVGSYAPTTLVHTLPPYDLEGVTP